MELQQLNLDDVIAEKVVNGGKKYCSSCTLYKPEVGGQTVISGKGKPVKRWRCATCTARQSESMFASKRKK